MVLPNRGIRSRIASLRRSRIVSIATSILGTQVVTSLLGVAYWTVAARGMPVTTVGLLGSATSVTILLGIFGVLGCGTLMISRLGAAPEDDRRELLAAAVVSSCCGGALLAAAFGLLAWRYLARFAFLTPEGATFWWLILAVAVTATGGVFDQATLVMGRPILQVVRNGVASAIKVILLGGMLLAGRHSVACGLAVWAIGQLVACMMATSTAARLLPSTRPVTASGIRNVVVRHWREAMTHHSMNMALAAPSMLQPVIIAAVISAEANATFTTVRLVGMMTFVAPFALAMALFASTPVGDERLEQRSRQVFRISLWLSVAIYVGLFVTAPLVLRVFGQAYAADGTHYLRVLALASPLLVFKDQYIALARARRDLRSAMPYILAATLLEVAGTLAGANIGDLGGAIWGWNIALACGALWVSLKWRGERGDRRIRRRRQCRAR